jgi:hypothetical protein
MIGIMDYIVVCSDLEGLEKEYCRYVLGQDEDYRPSVYFPEWLDHGNLEDKLLGLQLARDEIFRCGRMWVFVRNGTLTQEMVDAIGYATNWISGDKLRYFDATDPKDIIEMKHLDKTKVPTKAQLQGPKTYATDAKDKLGMVAKALREGKRYEDLQDALESFLGPVDASGEQDLEADAKWEEEYRKGRDG